jgi:hypothetical protein
VITYQIDLGLSEIYENKKTGIDACDTFDMARWTFESKDAAKEFFEAVFAFGQLAEKQTRKDV